MTNIISIKLKSLAKYESAFSVSILAFIYVYVFLGKLDNTDNEIESNPSGEGEVE